MNDERESPAGPWDRGRSAAVSLLMLTAVAGGLDATAYLFLGGTFVSAQTGTILLLSMNISGNHAVDTTVAITSLVAFVLGASACGAIVPKSEPGGRWPARVPYVIGAEAVLVSLGAAIGAVLDPSAEWLVAPLAFAMGMQATIARRIGFTYLTASTLTSALTLGGMRSPLGDRSSRTWWYFGWPLISMVAGATGVAFVASGSVAVALGVVAVVVVVAGLLFWRRAGREQLASV